MNLNNKLSYLTRRSLSNNRGMKRLVRINLLDDFSSSSTYVNNMPFKYKCKRVIKFNFLESCILRKHYYITTIKSISKLPDNISTSIDDISVYKDKEETI